MSSNEDTQLDTVLGSTSDLPLRPAPEWRNTLAKVIKSVVSLHYAHVYTFDADNARCSQATGFVVDKVNGYILTNRHVVGPGPFWGHCTFSNHEECDVEVVYFDPVHDFAFLHFDPAAIRYADVDALPVRPDAAQVGVEVRVVGNDSGEVLSIASAVLSRLDRNAPLYGGRYQDFNTNYIQAAAVAKGGSSGSPVVDIDGNAIALQAGGKTTSSATNYFLPLQRVERALRCLQKNEKITRGTIQTQWKFESFDICKRLGLNLELEAEMRSASPGTNTMLVAERVLPNGPAHGKIQKGDLLIRANGKLLLSFIDLDEILDSSVGDNIHLNLRRGDQDIDVAIPIQDLHTIMPSRFVIVAEAIFHDLSYGIARYYGIACQGVCVSTAGSLIELPVDALIDSVNGRTTPDLETFVDVMRNLPSRKDVKMSYRKLTDLHTKASVFTTILASWYPKIESWTRREDYKRWNLAELDFYNQSPSPKIRTGTFPAISGLTNLSAAYIANTIVRVSFLTQTWPNGSTNRSNNGYGIVVDAQKGLVLVSRAIVPHYLCHIALNMANFEVPAKVKFLHPFHNYALLKYEPEKVDAPVETAKFSSEPAKVNAKVTMICVHSVSSIRTAVETTITEITSTSINASTHKPQYRAINIDAISVETRIAAQNAFGVMVGTDGLVQAVWLLFDGPPGTKQPKTTSEKYGLQAATIKPVIDRISDGKEWKPRVLDAEMRIRGINLSRKHGVAEIWFQKVAEANPRHLLYAVKKLSCSPQADTTAKDQLEETDFVLTLNDKLVTNMSGFGELYDSDTVTATIVRGGKEMVLNIPTVSTEQIETTRAIRFCGAILHQPHLAVRQLMSKLPSEVYISERSPGTPADLFKLIPTHFITHVNDTETSDLDTFMDVVKDIPDNTFFRLRTVSPNLIPGMVTMKKFDYYYPMKVFEKNDKLASLC